MFDINDKCRFKTEKEFLNVYGTNWRSRVAWNIAGQMDFLFGKDFTITRRVGSRCYSNINTESIGWWIGEDMLVYKE